MGQQGGCKDADDGASDDPVKILMMLMMMMTKMMRKKLTNSGDADSISKWMTLGCMVSR